MRITEYVYKYYILLFCKGYNQALALPYFLANLIDPCYCRIKLTDGGEKKKRLGICKRNFGTYILTLVNEIFRKNNFFPGISIWTRYGESN